MATMDAPADPPEKVSRGGDPSDTGQLRALEAGWDELLS